MKKMIVGIVAAALLLAAIGCPSYIEPTGTTGTLLLNLESKLQSKTLLPTLDVKPVFYDIDGTGPEGQRFFETINGEHAPFEYLRFGEWNIHVTARNAAGTAIGDGNGTAFIHVEGTTPLSITVRPYSGLGSLDLSVSWFENEVETPVIRGILRGKDQNDTLLVFTEENTTGGKQLRTAATGQTLPVGYYTLIVSIFDEGDGTGDTPLSMGAVEVARILKGQNTSGSFELRGVAGMGKLSVNIEKDFDEPIEVSIENNATLPASITFNGGGAFTAQAAVPANDEHGSMDQVTYIWYLNGQSVGEGTTYTVDMNASPLYQTIDGKYAPGHYRLDVTAFSTDGSRGGSASYEFDVTGNPVQIVTPDIIFTSDVNGNLDIFSMAEDGSQVKQLTESGNHDQGAKLNNAKTKIVYFSNQGGDNEIWVMNSDGSNKIQLTNNAAADDTPVWSPDGNKIAYRSHRDGNWEIYVIDVNGSNDTRITNNSYVDHYFSWFPDSTKLVYNGLPAEATDWDIWICDADGSNKINLSGQITARDMFPQISPDGTKILFHSERNGASDIYAMNLDGSGLTRLTNMPSNQDDFAFWSPDGSKIAHRHFNGSSAQVRVMNADGSGQVTVTDNSYSSSFAAWSPDSQYMLVNSTKDGNNEMYKVNLTGSVMERLTNSPAGEHGQDWK